MAIGGASRDLDVRDLGEGQRQRVAQVLDAAAVLGRDQDLAVDPQAVELGEAALRLLGVRLVDHQHGGLAVAPEVRPDLLVGGDQPLLAVDQEDQQIALLDGHEDLLVEPERIVPRHQPAGVDDLDRAVLGQVRSSR